MATILGDLFGGVAFGAPDSLVTRQPFGNVVNVASYGNLSERAEC